MTYTLITANRNYSSWSLRPWVLMKALVIEFVDRLEPFAQPDNYDVFRQFSPTGQVPVLLDRDRVVADSLAIALYLAERHTDVWPVDEAARIYAQGAVAEMHGGFGHLCGDCPMNVGVRVQLSPMSQGLHRNLARLREIFEQGLAQFGGPWLAGAEFSVVDAFYAPVAFRIRTYGLDVGTGQAWVAHMLAHPAMQQWEAEALAETWREVSHEHELTATGVVTADYRST